MLGAQTVLIVEDNVSTRTMLANLVANEGYEAIQACNPIDALEKVNGISPGVALLDLGKDNGEYPKLESKLHSVNPDWICAMLASDNDFDEAVSAFRHGVYQFTFNPLEPTELLNQLRMLLEVATLQAEKRRFESELRKSQQSLNAILDGTSDIVFLKDLELRYVQLNKLCTTFLGRPYSSIIGHTDDELFDSETAMRLSLVERRVLEGEWVDEEMRLHLHGQDKSYHVSRRPVFNGNGAVDGLLCIIRDITEEKMLESKLTQAQKMEAIGVLAGGIAHDFNNILGAMVGHVDLALLGEKRGMAAGPHLIEVQKATNRAAGLVKQILAFTRQDNQDVSPVKMALILQETSQLIRAALPSTIQLCLEISDADCVVMANPTHIHQIIMNLATNAWHALNSGRGQIFLGLKRSFGTLVEEGPLIDGAYVELSVKDDGCGIPSEKLPRIFEPFFTTKQKGKGTGLGLAVVKDIVKRAGGTINVSTEVGIGTEIKVILPCIEECNNESSEREQPMPTGAECILYVDDEESLVDIGQSFFERLGYRVIGLTNPVEALNTFLLAPEKIDLVVTDQTMPEMTGLELAKKIRDKRDIPILVCSGYMDPSSQLTEVGEISFLRKPIVLRQFAEIVRQVLDSRKSR